MRPLKQTDQQKKPTKESFKRNLSHSEYINTLGEKKQGLKHVWVQFEKGKKNQQ